MAIQVQHKRGVLANKPALAAGEFYFATDSNQIFVGSTPVPLVSEVFNFDRTAQNSAISATTVFTPSVTGFYRVYVSISITRAASSSTLCGSTGIVLAYTDGDSSASVSSTMALRTSAGAVAINTSTVTVGTTLEGDKVIYAKAGVAVTIAVGYTSAGTPTNNMQYALHARVDL